MGMLRECFVAATRGGENFAQIVLLRCTLVKATAGGRDFNADVAE
jgi:hypothetical protein